MNILRRIKGWHLKRKGWDSVPVSEPEWSGWVYVEPEGMFAPQSSTPVIDRCRVHVDRGQIPIRSGATISRSTFIADNQSLQYVDGAQDVVVFYCVLMGRRPWWGRRAWLSPAAWPLLRRAIGGAL